MTIKEPTANLWVDVKPHTEWPATDEAAVLDLAKVWGDAANGFERQGAQPTNPGLVDGWKDGNGQTYRDRVAKLHSVTFTTGAQMKRLSWLTQQYSYDVAHTKLEIRKLIEANDDAYDNMNGIFGLFADTEGRKSMVTEIANAINKFLDLMAERIAARGKGEPEKPRPVFTPKDLTSPGGADKAEDVPPPPDPALDPNQRRIRELGAKRENRVADLTNGQVQGEPGGPGLIVRTATGRTDVDVIGSDGSYIAVGGPAKANNLSALGTHLKVLREAAEQEGRTAKAYFEQGTPESALNVARRQLGDNNVFVFDY
jgi:hypothetical protein